MKQERYLNEDGTDTIDKWAATRTNEAFRDIMFAQVEKYNDRLGKKDSIVSEVGKMADYMNRWLEYEKEWAESAQSGEIDSPEYKTAKKAYPNNTTCACYYCVNGR